MLVIQYLYIILIIIIIIVYSRYIRYTVYDIQYNLMVLNTYTSRENTYRIHKNIYYSNRDNKNTYRVQYLRNTAK